MPPLPQLRILHSVVFLMLVTAVLRAQTASPRPASTPTQPPSAGGPVVELSPFEVNASRDVGYLGQNTIAGSRMRTELKDLGAAISPMTLEFLQDIAATNIEEAMEYGMNARIETDDGRAAGPVASLYNDPVRDVRIRGLPGGSRTVNYFARLGEIDTFNAERLELSRGPNAILYGFGSPAGVVNAGTKQAQTDLTAHQVSFRVDSWGGYRATADTNVPLLRTKAALRAIVLHGEESSWRSAGHNDSDRVYLAATWRPERKTVVKADFEVGKINRYVPRPFFGIDMSSPWYDAGQPYFNNFDPRLAAGALGTPGNPFRNSGNTAVTGVEDYGGANYIVVSDSLPYTMNFARFTQGQTPTAPRPTDFARGRKNPKATLDANWVGSELDVTNFSVTVQRELFQGLHAEAGVSQQKLTGLTDNLNSWNTMGVSIDSNLFYPNGTPKPRNENLYYFEMEQSRALRDVTLRQFRGTLGYERDFQRMGRLRLAGLAELSREKDRSLNKRLYLMNGPEVSSGGFLHPDPQNVANRMHERYYFSNPAVFDDPNFRIPTPHDFSSGVRYQDPATGRLSTIHALWMNANGATSNWANRDLSSYMGVGQFYTLKNRLVITAGYRTDELSFYDSPSIRDPAAEARGNIGMWLPQVPTGTPSKVSSGDTRTAGAVWHALPWLSLFYNTSTSVTVPSSARVLGPDPAESRLPGLAPSPVGKTRDLGLKLDLLQHRLFVTGTYYQTDLVNDYGFSQFQVHGHYRAIWNAMITSGILPPDELAIATAQYERTASLGGYLLDSKSKGYELEIVGQLLPGWSVSLNFAKGESMKSNIAPEVRAYLDHWKPLWLKYRDLAISQNANVAGAERLPFADFNPPAVIAATGDFTANTDTINERIADMEDVFLDNSYVFNGKPIIGDNKYNLNLRTRYSFQSGPLKGLLIGGGTRLRKGRVAGAIGQYEYAPNSTYADNWNGRVLKDVRIVEAVDQALLDLQVTYRTKIFRGRVGWTVQLNVNNALDEDAFIVNNTHPTTGAPTTYRYQDPRQFILTNTFSF